MSRSPPKKTGPGAPIRALYVCLALLSLLVGCRETPGRLASTPRIVTLSPSATEIVATLGGAGWLVGVDNYSEFPPEVANLPKVGSYISPNLEAIIRLRPTLVVVDDIHSAQKAALLDRGVASVACPIHGLADVKAALRSIGARIGRSKEAAAAIAGIDTSLDEFGAAKPAKHPRVLAVIDRDLGGLGNMVAAGPGSWVDELLAVVGGDNVLAGAGTRYPKISVEEVLRTSPDTILDLSRAAWSAHGLTPWSALDVPAVAATRITAVSDAFVTAPSPRVALALERLATALRR